MPKKQTLRDNKHGLEADRIYELVTVIEPIRDWVRKHSNTQGHQVRNLTAFAYFLSLIALVIMSEDPSFQICSLLVGSTAAGIDYLVEYAGIARKQWSYPGERTPVGVVPLTVPLLFFCCGIIATFVVFLMSEQRLIGLTFAPPIIEVGLIQIMLVVLTCYFLMQYILGKIKTLTFWALPLSLTLYMAFPEPMLLAVSILPIYIDYYLEKRLVRSSNISYDGYNEQTAINVALSYFPTTLLILEVVVVLLNVL
jgi:hypothetical protein